MPMTLTCTSCGKRFRARDESAGKRVKCPYCGAAVLVPWPEEVTEAVGPAGGSDPPPPVPPASLSSAQPGRPTGSGPVPPPPFPRMAAPAPTPAPVAPADDWGATEPPRPRYAPPRPVPAVTATGEDYLDPPRGSQRATLGAARGGSGNRPAEKTPEQLAAPAWRKARAGMAWVRLALLWLALPGFVGLGKTVYTRTVGPLPSGPGGDWVSIPGYLNTNEPKTIEISKEKLLDAGLYGIPVLLGGLLLAFGRLTCGAAPRSSGAKGLFALSGLFSFVALAALVTAAACDHLLFAEEYHDAALAFLVAGIASEFWFLNGLSACGGALKRPQAPRAIGLLGLLVALIVVFVTVGWPVYKEKLRPRPVTDEWVLGEQAALLVTWLLVIGLYWRAVGAVRAGIADFLETVKK